MRQEGATMAVEEARRQTANGRLLFSVDDFYKMAEIGIFDEDSRVELLGGEVFAMSPIGSKHAACVNRLLASLTRQVGDEVIVSPQNPVRLSDDTEPEPDVSVLRPKPDFYASAHPRPADILLIVEVAETSLAYDRDRKLPFYAAAGIPEVWIVDLAGGAVTAYSGPSGEAYRQTREYRRGEALSPAALPQISLPVEAIIGRIEERLG